MSSLDLVALLQESGLRPNKNQKKELTELAEEIGVRERKSIKEVAGLTGILPIIGDYKLSAPDRLKRIKDKLFEYRYPEFSQAKAAFRQKLKELKMEPGIKVSPTPYFEDDKINVEFTYRTPDELKEIIRSLQKLSKVDLVRNALENKENNS